MKILMLLVLGLCVAMIGRAQYTYTIKADSVKITNSCDSAELIIENHTQGVPGFLYNTGRGRTIFKRALQKISDSSYLIGADTLNVPSGSGGGGSKIAAASNGLTDSLGTVELGGTTCKSTDIEIPTDTPFTINWLNFTPNQAFLGLGSDSSFPLMYGVETQNSTIDGYQIFNLGNGNYEQDFYQNDTNMLSINNNFVTLFQINESESGPLGPDWFYVDGSTSLGGGVSTHPFHSAFSITGGGSGLIELGAYVGDSLTYLSVDQNSVVSARSLRTKVAVLSGSNGGTVTLSDNSFNFIQESGALSSLTIVFPSGPGDGDKVTIKSQYAITSVTMTAPFGPTIAAPINLAAGQSVEFVYSGSTWY